MNWSGLDISTLILDRDGVINRETGNFVKTPDEWQVLAGSLNAIACLSQQGYRIFVATNQSGIARGLYTENTLKKIHQLMLDQVSQSGGVINGIYYCPHVDSDNCECRKPKSGLLRQISEDHGIDLSKSVMVGDSIRDLQAGMGAGTYSALISRDEELIHKLKHDFAAPMAKVPVYADLPQFVNDFLA